MLATISNQISNQISKKIQAFFVTGAVVSSVVSSIVPFNPAKVEAQEISSSPSSQVQKTNTKNLSNANLLAESVKPSVVRVVVGCEGKARWSKSGKIYNLEIGGHGSGFFVNSNGYIVTNAHVTDIIEKPEECKNILLKQFAEKLTDDGEDVGDIEQLKLLEIKPIKQVVLANGDKFPFEVVVSGKPVGEGKDVAIIKINIRNAPILKLADSDQVKVFEALLKIGMILMNLERIYRAFKCQFIPQLCNAVFDWVAAAGYPGVADLDEDLGGKKALNEATFTDGKVSAIKNLKDGTPVIQISAPSTRGNSGGPVFNELGEVIGIVTFGPYSKDSFTFIFTSNTIMQFLQQAGVANSGRIISQRYNEGQGVRNRQDNLIFQVSVSS